MPEVIIDGRGSGNLVGVTQDNKLMVETTVSNVSAGAEGTPHIGSPTLMSASRNGSIVTLIAGAGSELIVTGSVGITNTINTIGSVIITNTVAVSGNLGVVFDNDYVNVIQSGTEWGTIVNNRVAGSIVNLPNVNQGTNPWIVNGSVAITNNLKVNEESVGKSLAPVPGSQTYIGGLFNGSLYPLHVENGSELLVTGSVRIESPVSVTQSTSPWVTLGSSRVVQDSTTRQIDAGSVIVTNRVAGSIVNLPAVTQGTDPWTTLGSTAITNTVNTNILAGSVQTYSPVGVGSVRISEQGVTLDVSLGSTSLYGVGSIKITDVTTTNPMPVKQTRGTFGFSGASLITSGTAANFITPGAGSKILLKGFNASADIPTQFRLLFSGGTVISTFSLPASGTAAMNMLGMEPSGATNEPMAVGLLNAGSLNITVYTEDTL